MWNDLLPRRTFLTLSLALFLAAFVPVALACEVSAGGHGGCMNMACDQTRAVRHCPSDQATASPTISKAERDAAWHLALALAPTASHAPAGGYALPDRAYGHPSRQQTLTPRTLQSLFVLLRI